MAHRSRALVVAAVFILIGLLVGGVASLETTRLTPTEPLLNFPNQGNEFSLVYNTNTSEVIAVVNSTVAGALTNADSNLTVLGTALFNETLKELGWDYLYVAPDSSLLGESDDGSHLGYYIAGYMEGALTYQSMMLASVPRGFVRLPLNVQGWITEHISLMRASFDGVDDVDAFHTQLAKLFQQMIGIRDGFNNATSAAQVTLEDVFVASFGDEIGDVNGTFYYPSVKSSASRHCSALIKVTDDDLFVAHDTWSSFQSMRRQYKVYAFETTVAMSGYPGQIASGDDWYMTSNQLAIQETTNDFYNTSLYAYITANSTSEFLRVMIATYLATNGSDWVRFFSTENSGTYNNQYMVVDMNRWQPGQKGASLQDGLLWVAEQIPGHVEAADVTSVLRNTSYWASFNVAYFPYIYNVSGFEAMKLEQGDFWSYTKYARPEIFRRNQSTIKTLSDMQLMMRYNDYQWDQFSIIPNCSTCATGCNPSHSAMLTIASRGDLNPEFDFGGAPVCYGPISFVGHRNHTATDSKIAAWSSFQNGQLTGFAISGPTAVQQPHFAFSTSGFSRPLGLPDLWNFTWVSFALPTQYYYVAPRTDLPGSNALVIGVVVGVAVIGFGAGVLGVIRLRKRRTVDEYIDLAAREPRSAVGV